MCPFERSHFLTWIELNPGYGTFKALQMKVEADQFYLTTFGCTFLNF